VAAAVRACALPFGVSSIAQAAAVASLAAEAELFERVDAIVEERARVVDALRSQGWDLPDAQGNFVWFPLGERALEFAVAAEGVGIVVRPFAGEGVRVSIGEAEANGRLIEIADRLAD
jgi:histidinol-phosphate aminotransferase